MNSMKKHPHTITVMALCSLFANLNMLAANDLISPKVRSIMENTVREIETTRHRVRNGGRRYSAGLTQVKKEKLEQARIDQLRAIRDRIAVSAHTHLMALSNLEDSRIKFRRRLLLEIIAGMAEEPAAENTADELAQLETDIEGLRTSINELEHLLNMRPLR